MANKSADRWSPGIALDRGVFATVILFGQSAGLCNRYFNTLLNPIG